MCQGCSCKQSASERIACTVSSEVFLVMPQIDNSAPMLETLSNTAQKHAQDLAQLWQLTQDAAEKNKPYRKALKSKQDLERSLSKVVVAGQHTVLHQGYKYQVKVSEGKYDVSADDFKRNLQEKAVCSGCKTAAEEAYKAKRRTKTDIKVVDREQHDIQTPSCSEELRPSKRQRYCTGIYTCKAVTPANVSCSKTEYNIIVLSA